jgi:hypothetical protein
MLYFKKTTTPWPQSANELCRQSDRRFSAKLVPTFLRIEVATWSSGQIPTAPIAVAAMHELSSPAPTLGSWVRIPLWLGCFCVFCVRIISELKLLIK